MKKRQGNWIQKIMAVLLSAALVAGMTPKAVPITVFAQEDTDLADTVSGNMAETLSTADVPTSGSCGVGDGDNVTWTLSDNGVLTISGTGEMENYSEGGAPWYGNYVDKVVIEDGVINIGEYAFYGCGLKEVVIPNSVISIGKSAFYYCVALTSVTIPDSVEHIEDSTFSDCYTLTSVTLPNSVTSIGEYAFRYCKALSSITIPDSVTSIGGNAFVNCESLISVTLPNSVTSIEEWAFYQCKSLTSVTIPASVTEVGNYAFYGCSSLANVTILDGVTSIGEYTFRNCSSLSSITIPASIKNIGVLAFEECVNLNEVIVEGMEPPRITNPIFDDCKFINDNLKGIRVPKDAYESYCTSWSAWEKYIYPWTEDTTPPSTPDPKPDQQPPSTNTDDNAVSDSSFDNNSEVKNNVIPANNTPADNAAKTAQSGGTEPKTGDNTPIQLYATLAMIAGFAYLYLYFTDHERGMTEQTKKELVSGLIEWAKKGGRLRRLFALATIFILLVYYHSIGKQTHIRFRQPIQKA